MSKHIDIEGIFRRNRMAVDGHVNCSVEDWNNIVTYIANLEERERDIKAEAVLDSIEYVYDENLYLDNSVKYTLEEYADKLERGEL